MLYNFCVSVLLYIYRVLPFKHLFIFWFSFERVHVILTKGKGKYEKGSRKPN